VAAALDEAHAHGVIHRDVKPANILFDQYDNACLADFGIARLVEGSVAFTGTPAFMAPEMAQGRLSPLVDVYALGVSLFQALTGQMPYRGDTPVDILSAHLSQPIPSLRSLHPDLPAQAQRIVDQALAKDPRQRYPSAGQLAADLAGLSRPSTVVREVRQTARSRAGRIEAHHRFLLRLHLEHIDELNIKIETLNEEINRLLQVSNLSDELRRLDGIPGVGLDIAHIIVAELGTDMSRFSSAGHAASWAGLAPGKHESAGHNYSSRTRPGNRYLKTALISAAHAVSHTRHNYLAAQFRRLVARRGKKRALVAVAHSILVIAYHMLRDGSEYHNLGSDYFDRRNQEQLQRHLVKRLENLGYKVSLEASLP
jgi:serine/threonine protein kinase